TSQGSQPLNYQWYSTSGPVPGGTNRVLTFPHVQLSDAGDYFVIVTNYGGSATSTIASITVTADTTPPYVVSVGSIDGLYVGVCFNEEVNPISLGEISNYSVNNGGVGVMGVTPRPDGRSVILKLDATITGPFTVQVYSMTDLANQFSDFSEANG